MANLILKNLFKSYNNSRSKNEKTEYAVNDLNLECNDGEFIGILGPSGCGKTTTLRMIAGLEDITKGEIYIGDTLVNHIPPKDRSIGLAFEDYALYPPLSVYENIAFNLRAKKVPDSQIKQEVERISALLKVDNLLTMRPVNLSGGQKQRVNIARAIIRKPKILLLDEPLSHLDGKMRQVLRTEIKRLHHEIKCTTILVTHDQLEAMSLADRIAIMKDGVLQQYGTPLEIYENPVNEFVANFIGEPPMNLCTVVVEQEGDKLFFSFGDRQFRLAVPPMYYKLVRNGMKVRLGIRPTDLMVEQENYTGSQVAIDVFEDLGDERRITLLIGEETLSIILEDHRMYRQGEKIRLRAHEERVLLFDNQTGERIR